jgi:DNA-directed RNA polymerase specialized sigma24 family protein
MAGPETSPAAASGGAPLTPGESAYALEVGRRRAREQGLPADLADDCASAFLIHLAARGPHLRPEPDRWRPWLRRCADHFARDFCRSLARQRERETPWPDERTLDGMDAAADVADPQPSPLSQLISQHARHGWFRL